MMVFKSQVWGSSILFNSLTIVWGNYVQLVLQLRQLSYRQINYFAWGQQLKSFRTNRDSNLGWLGTRAPVNSHIPAFQGAPLYPSPPKACSVFLEQFSKLPLYFHSSLSGFFLVNFSTSWFFFLFSKRSLANPSFSVTLLALGTHPWLGLALQGGLFPPLPSALA